MAPRAWLYMYSDWQSTNDARIVVTGQPYAVRPQSNDLFEITSVDDRIEIWHNETTIRATVADNVELERSLGVCNACLSSLGYLVGRLANAQNNVKGDEDSDDQISVVHYWHELIVKKASLDGCPICKMIWYRGLRHWFEEEVLVAHLLAGAQLAPRTEFLFNAEDTRTWDGTNPGDARLLVAMSMADERHPPSQMTYRNLLRFQLWPITEAYDRYFVCSSEIGPPDIRTLSINDREESEPTTRSCRQLALEWLAECRRNTDGKHDACNARSGCWVPTRLLDLSKVEESGRIWLVSLTLLDSEDNDKEYISLSHCWGEWGRDGLPSLNLKNINERQEEGIDLEDLPRTFRDAVEIAGWFNVKYLWIDSLCIIQDSEPDWEHEAALMGEVYKHAFLNISATSSADARGGCFYSRDPVLVQPFKIYMKPLKTAWWVVPDERILFDWIKRAPVSERAWVYQERELSRRILHFTEHEVFWECLAESPSFRSETYPHGSPLPRDFMGQKKLPPIRSTAALIKDDLHLLESWIAVCHRFSERKLSYWSDRLPALAGIAKEFGQNCPSDTYLAGSWLSMLPHALLWMVDRTLTPPEQRLLPRPRTDEFVVPSWSWLSVTVPIRLFSTRDISHSMTNTHSIISIKQVDYKITGKDPYGRISQASLTIEGHVRQITCIATASVFSEEQISIDLDEKYIQRVYVDGRRDRAIGRTIPQVSSGFVEDTDHTRDDTRPREYHCLLVAVEHSDIVEERTLVGLLLEQAEQPHHFKRVGRITFRADTALKMRYKAKGDDPMISAHTITDPTQRRVYPARADRLSGSTDELPDPNAEAWTKLWGQVAPMWFGGCKPKSFIPDMMGPASLYEFDGNADTEAFEQLRPETITLV